MKRPIASVVAFGLVLGVAGASNSTEMAPEARAYFGLSFGGERMAPRDFHYGLRVDHDSRFVEAAPPLLQIDFTRRGVNAARVNGLPVLRRDYRLRQADPPPEVQAESPSETAAETPAEMPAEASAETPAGTLADMPGEDAADSDAAGDESGFFSRAWNGIKGWFGAGDDATETASGEILEEEPTEGSLLDLDAIDWGLVAVGAVSLGLAAGAVDSGDDATPGDTADGDTTGGGTTGGGTTGGGTTGGTEGGTTGGTGGGLLGGLAGGLGGLVGGLSGYSRATPDRDLEREIEYRKWLDGGTGQMGDLGGGD